MRTELAKDVNKHAFEVAGLGKAPFKFIGATDNVITHPDGTQQAGGTCDYCGNGIRTECHVQGSDGRTFKVGCNCIEKVGEKGILKAYKTSPEYRAKQRAIRQRKAQEVADAIRAIMARPDYIEKYSAKLHPMGYTDRKTGRVLNGVDNDTWLFNNSGAAGRAHLLKRLQVEFPPTINQK